MKLVLRQLDKPIVFYLDKNTLHYIIKQFRTMGDISKQKIENDIVDYDGIIINSYPNIDDDIINNEFTYIVDDIVVSTYATRTNDSLVVKEDNQVRVIEGYDENIYTLNTEYFVLEDRLYSIFPNYKIKTDGSIERVAGSALENFKKLKSKKIKKK